MELVCDTSTILAVVLNEPAKRRLRQHTRGADLIAPPSLHWEIGNALSAGFKRGRLSLTDALQALEEYQTNIPIRFVEVSMEAAVRLAEEWDIYAYDAYVIECARQYDCPLLTLDGGQRDAAERVGIEVTYLTP